MSYEARSREIADALIAIEGVSFRPTAPITFKSESSRLSIATIDDFHFGRNSGQRLSTVSGL